jgi:anti-sigma regulatory factor (Ser/Thr protein kinase)
MSGAAGIVRTSPEATAGAALAPGWSEVTRWVALGAEPSSVGPARRYANSMLGAWNIPDSAADDVELVVSELLTNAIRATPRHSPVQVWLRLSHRIGHVRVEVADSSPDALPPPLTPAEGIAALTAEHGRGLIIVAAVSQEHGAWPLPDGGKVVWAILASR